MIVETSKSRSNGNNGLPPISIPATLVITGVIPTFIFQLPIAWWLPQANTITTDLSPRDMIALSRTCKTFYLLYKPTLTKLREEKAKELIKCFFMPTKENVEKAKKKMEIFK